MHGTRKDVLSKNKYRIIRNLISHTYKNGTCNWVPLQRGIKYLKCSLYMPGRHKRITGKDLSFLASFLNGGDFMTNTPPVVPLGK